MLISCEESQMIYASPLNLIIQINSSASKEPQRASHCMLIGMKYDMNDDNKAVYNSMMWYPL